VPSRHLRPRRYRFVTGPDGKPLPGIAPVAKAQGAYIAARVVADLEKRESPPFRYRNLGSLATIGRKSAVVQIGRMRLTGFIARLIWSVAHIYFLIDFRSRLSAVLNWVWNYLTFQRGARLITGLTGSLAKTWPRPPRPRPFTWPAPSASAAPPRRVGGPSDHRTIARLHGDGS
jgi:hypothetical protein